MATQQWASLGNLWVEYGRSVSPGQCSFKIGWVWEGSVQASCFSPVDCPIGKSNQGTLAAAFLALTPVPHNAVFPSITLEILEPPSLCHHPGCMFMGESMCIGPLKEYLNFSLLLSYLMTIIPTDFYSQILGEFLFPGVRPWFGELPYGTGNPLSFREGSAAILSLQVLHSNRQVWPQLLSSLSPSYQFWGGSFFIIFRYMCYDQLNFSWLSTLIVY